MAIEAATTTFYIMDLESHLTKICNLGTRYHIDTLLVQYNTAWLVTIQYSFYTEIAL